MKTVLISILLSLFLSTVTQAADHMSVASKQGKFEDVRDDLIMAIENRGLKINHTNHIADMLARTGTAVGDTRQVYGQAEQVEFCKADLSRTMMLADPSNIVFCPYIIAIYTTPDVKGRVFVAYRKPIAFNASDATEKALKGVDDLLAGIVNDTIKGVF
jgi:uncharacterized protein (DUF302 family)